ncbi:MAG: peptide ABC transporter substrate-binding protein [Oscillospiraceae bacterium]|nr:peptide ABC transporter substrate-binding protein [Oscillospiraceae bacterium]
MPKRLIIILACIVCFVLPLTGCSDTQAIIRYDVSRGTKNLDPQFATDPTAQLVIYNVFEGLVRSNPDGQVVPAAAESYTISADEKTYTFILRDNMHWRSGDKVTAYDFEFALERLFSPIAQSPYALNYISIKNASKVLEKKASVESLGIRAENEKTLVITLEAPNAFFLEQLAHSSAMPCSRKSFHETKGRYGLRLNCLDVNGPFYVKYWDNNSYIGLRRNGNYYDKASVVTNGVNLYIGRETPETEDSPAVTAYDLLLKNQTDCAKVTYEQMIQLTEKGYTASEMRDTSWCLLYNMDESSELKEASVREAFTKSIDRQSLNNEFFLGAAPSNRIVPPSVILMGSRYIDSVPPPIYPPYNPQEASAAYFLGLEALNASQMKNIRFLVEDKVGVQWLAGCLQQMWQKELGVFVQIEILPSDDLVQRLKKGSYDIALTGLVPSNAQPADILSRFSTNSADNVTHYQSQQFDTYLEQAVSSRKKDEIRRYYSYAETLLAQDLPVVPLWTQNSYRINGKDVSGIQYFPDDAQTYFKYAQRSK